MRLYLNDLTELPKKCDELGETVVCMSGYDRPKYVDPRAQVSGDLGFDTWIEPWNKATFNALTAEVTLTPSKWYSILVVPVDRDTVEYDDFQRGTPNLPAMPEQADVSGTGMQWNIPVFPQQTIYDVGSDTAGDAAYITDTTKTWTNNQWQGYSVLNVDTGESALIAANGGTLLECTLTKSIGDRYQIIKDKCKVCHGAGRVEKEKSLSVNIPAGVETGTRIRLSGEGEAGVRGGPAGDLYIFIEVNSHPLFEREGLNLYCRVPVSIATAALGGEIEVPTIDGGRSRVKVPEGSQSGRQMRLRGKGMPALRGGPSGDMMIELSVETPVKLTARQREILREFDKLSEENNPQGSSFFASVKSFWDSMKS